MRLGVLILVSQLLGYAPAILAESSPRAVVQELYDQVVARKPIGIPKGADKKAIWPFLNRRLTRRLDEAQRCEDDYFRQYKGDNGKPEFGWIESGIFSGENEQATPAAAIVERVESQRDGSFHVRVRLESAYSDERPWQVIAVVKKENGRFVVDDVLLPQGDSAGEQRRLTDSFIGCDDSHWKGGPRK